MSSDEESINGEKECVIDYNTGLPVMSKDAKLKGWSKMRGMIGGLMIVPRLIGFGIAFAIYYPMKTTYDPRIEGVRKFLTGDSNDAGYLFLSLVVFSVVTACLNLFPMMWKALIMPGNAENLRANMMIYAVNVANGIQPLPAVVLQEDGDVGKYNRANRALQHFNENGLPVGLNIFAGGFIFPLPIFILTIVYAIARVWYQIAYATGGYGTGCCKHAMPFMIHGALLPPIFEGLMWIIGITMLTTEHAAAVAVVG